MSKTWPEESQVDFAESGMEIALRIAVTADGAVRVELESADAGRIVMSRRLNPADDENTDVVVVRDATGTQAAALAGKIYDIQDEIENAVKRVVSEVSKP